MLQLAYMLKRNEVQKNIRLLSNGKERNVIGQYELASESTFTPLKMVLVVEDDVDFGTNLVQVIREETVYHAMHVTDAFEALRVIGHLKCDLFLLDYQLPGIDGIDLYDLLCSMPGYEKAPAIVISASARLPQREMEKRNLMSLNKPFELDALLQTIQELLDKEKQSPQVVE